MYTENTSDAWHIPRYPTRKYCIFITSIYCGYLTYSHGVSTMSCYQFLKLRSSDGGLFLLLTDLCFSSFSTMKTREMPACFVKFFPGKHAPTLPEVGTLTAVSRAYPKKQTDLHKKCTVQIPSTDPRFLLSAVISESSMNHKRKSRLLLMPIMPTAGERILLQILHAK